MNKNGCKAPKIICPEVICTKEYAPVCGDKPFICNATDWAACPALASTQKTYDNKCLANADGAQNIVPGKCKTNPICPVESLRPITEEERMRGCTYEKFTNDIGCSMSKLVCKVDKICPQVMPPPYSEAIEKMGCKLVQFTNSDGCKHFEYACPVVQWCSKEFKPVCAQKPFVCNAPPGATCGAPRYAPEPFANSCIAESAGARIDTNFYFTNGKCIPVIEEPTQSNNGY